MNRALRLSLPFLLFSLAVTIVPENASGAAHSNLEEHLPTRLEDAYPISYRGRELQLQTTYEKTETFRDRLTIRPALEYGIIRNGKLKVSAPFYAGSADRTNSGNTELEAFYNLWTEPLIWPAVSVAALAEFPTGKRAKGVDAGAKLILTKTVGWTSYLNRIHLNGTWWNNAQREMGERAGRFELVGGYQIRLGADTTAVADYVWEEEREEDIEIELAELGIRRQITPLTTLSLGGGVGLNRHSPDYRVTFGFQHELAWFFSRPDGKMYP